MWLDIDDGLFAWCRLWDVSYTTFDVQKDDSDTWRMGDDGAAQNH